MTGDGRRSRKWRLRLTAAGACLVLIVAAAAALAPGASSSSPDGVYIGVQPYYPANQRTAVGLIASDLERHPNAKWFEVRWSTTRWAWLHMDEEMDRHALVYEPSKGRLTEYSGGASGGLDGVTPSMVHEAARSDNPDKAFERFGCRGWP